jgi:hypothetical protein
MVVCLQQYHSSDKLVLNISYHKLNAKREKDGYTNHSLITKLQYLMSLHHNDDFYC